MSIVRIFCTEWYKILHRRSSLILLVPALLAFVMVLGVMRGVIILNLTTTDAQATATLIDTVFMIWNVASGTGLIGLICVLFACLSFTAERENGQLKLTLLRIGKRRNVMLGKFLAVLTACLASILLLLAASALGYLFFAADGQKLLSGTTICGLTTASFTANLGLNGLALLIFLVLSFLIGLYAGPFVTFVITMVALYGANALAGSTNFFAKLLPLHWSNALLLGENTTGMIWSVGFALLFSLVLLMITTQLFRHLDL